MITEQLTWTNTEGWDKYSVIGRIDANLVLVFGNRDKLSSDSIHHHFKILYPNADITFCSTAGEIDNTSVRDNSIVSTAIKFGSTALLSKKINIKDFNSSYDAGVSLATNFPKENLCHVLLFSDGLQVNGSKLVDGLNSVFGNSVSVTGGLAADGPNFKSTLVGLNEKPEENLIVAIGFYSNKLQIGFGSMGGWDSFGPRRLVTKAKDNILFELDGKSALSLYKEYLGPRQSELPGSALLFPLSIRMNESSPEIVRTVLSINEQEESLQYAGDIPEGYQARLMKANFDRLIDGAIGAAEAVDNTLLGSIPDLVLLISCVGRKLVLGQRIEEEIEGISDVFNNTPTISGFYSYGEISPFKKFEICELHNQTMTITTFKELE